VPLTATPYAPNSSAGACEIPLCTAPLTVGFVGSEMLTTVRLLPLPSSLPQVVGPAVPVHGPFRFLLTTNASLFAIVMLEPFSRYVLATVE
jgi:hypothetical protein